MKKSNVLWLVLSKNKRQQMWRIMKLTWILCVCFVCTLSANVMSQQKLSMNLGETSIKTVFEEIRKQTNKIVIYNDDRLALSKKVTADFKDMELGQLLDQVLAGSGLTYKFVDDYIVLIPFTKAVLDEKKSVRVKGWVHDKNKEPIAGVTVRLVGVSLGTATNAKGWFAIDLPVLKGELELSFVGFKKKLVSFTEKTDTLRIVMEEDMQQVDEVVVTGIFNKPKESFTGAVTAITKDDLKANYSRNILQTLANIDPSLRIVQNNKMGSDPNTLPEIRLRGASTLLTAQELKSQEDGRPDYNRPLFIMDGFEVDLERVMDMNENEIENITILKDASATAMYGARGANGVIVITTNRYTAGNIRVMYQGRVNLQIPDFSTYDNLMSAEEKFEIEKEYGLWDSEMYKFLYDEIEANIAKGLNYDWLKVPTRTGVGQTHILQVSGSQEAWNYSLDLNYQSTLGVMKESERKNFNGTMSLGYRAKNWNIWQSLSIGVNSNQDSPYGRFSEYVAMNRYWEPYDENGKPIEYYYHPNGGFNYPISNPLYDQASGYWSKTKYYNVRSNTRVKYNFTERFYTEVSFGISRKETKGDTYYPPSHKRFDTVTELDQKGSFSRGERENIEWQVRGMLYYTNTFRDKHMISTGFSTELSETTEDSATWTAVGFMADNIDHPGMSLSYPENGHVFGDKSVTRRASFSYTANYYYNQRYFVDGSITYNGASSFGKKSRFSPYYSIGGGWLVNNESFVQNHLPFINELRLRYSFGVVGNSSLAPQDYMEVFDRNPQDLYLGGICWTLNSFANPNLKQQNTLQHNMGFDLSIFNDRVSVHFNYYNFLTNNTMTDMKLPISHGFKTVRGNIGKIRNEGFEWYFNFVMLNKPEKNVRWTLNANVTRLKNTIVKLSEGFKEAISGQFKEMDAALEDIKYQEGKSMDALYGLRSVGIDPTSGQRVFLKADGVTTTLEQKAEDLVYLGDSQPKVNSTFSTAFTWKGLSVVLGFGVKWGGKQVNTTELNKGENVRLSSNLDRRLLKYGWRKIGDQARYKNQWGSTSRDIYTYACSDFVHKDNVFSCNNVNIHYSFPKKILKTIGLESLAISADLSDIFYFSTIERERGTYYPFSINPNFSISCTF